MCCPFELTSLFSRFVLSSEAFVKKRKDTMADKTTNGEIIFREPQHSVVCSVEGQQLTDRQLFARIWSGRNKENHRNNTVSLKCLQCLGST